MNLLGVKMCYGVQHIEGTLKNYVVNDSVPRSIPLASCEVRSITPDDLKTILTTLVEAGLREGLRLIASSGLYGVAEGSPEFAIGICRGSWVANFNSREAAPLCRVAEGFMRSAGLQ